MNPGRRGMRSAVRTAIVLEAVGVTVLVLRDGRPLWAVLRVAVVVLVATRALVSGRWFWLAFGVLGIGIGGAIAVPHLVKDGPSIVAVAALLTLLGGLVLGAAAARELLRDSTWRRRLLAVPVAFVLLQLVLLPLVGAVAATNVPPTELGDRTPADVGHPFDEVDLVTTDGVHLRGWYIPSRNGAALVVLHGSGSTRTSVLDHGAALADAGYGVLLLDTRGHGESGGDAMDFGWYGNLDIEAAVDHLAAQPDVEVGRIAALGLSMGGEQAITAAAADTRIEAVIAEGVTQRVPADGGWIAHDLEGWVRRGVERIMFTTAAVLTSAPQPIGLRPAIEQIAPRPVLLIAGQAADERAASRWLAAAAPASTSVWSLPDTPHTDALDRHRDEWIARVTAFLADAL